MPIKISPTAYWREFYSVLFGDINGKKIQGRGYVCLRVLDSL